MFSFSQFRKALHTLHRSSFSKVAVVYKKIICLFQNYIAYIQHLLCSLHGRADSLHVQTPETEGLQSGQPDLPFNHASRMCNYVFRGRYNQKNYIEPSVHLTLCIQTIDRLCLKVQLGQISQIFSRSVNNKTSTYILDAFHA